MKLVTRIILQLVVPATVAMIILMATTTGVLYDNVPQWSDDIKEDIREAELSNIDTRADIFGSTAETLMGQLFSDTRLLHAYSEELMNYDLPLENYYPSYYAVSSYQGTSYSDFIGTNRLDANGINTDVSVYYKDPGARTSVYKENSTALDNVYRTLYRANKAGDSHNYLALYLGFGDGLYKYFPGTDLTHFPNFQYTCASNGQPVTGYDPRCRGWHHAAKQSPNEVIASEPYIDAITGFVVITLSKAVVDRTGAIPAVVGTDVSISQLESILLEGTILENGYTYMIDNQGKAVVYPDISRDEVFDIIDLEFSTLAEKVEFDDVLTAMTSGQSGSANYVKGGDDWYIAYRKVEGTPYTIAMTVPYSDINRPVDEIEDKNNTTMAVGTIVTVIITAVALILSTWVNLLVAKGIVHPIKHLINLMEQMSKDNFDGELDANAPASADIRIIFNYFRQLIEAIRLGNEVYYKGDHQKALLNYKNVGQIMRDLKNPRGEGIALSGEANVLRLIEGASPNTLKTYQTAISNALEIIQGIEETPDNADVIKDARDALAARYMNFGVFMREQNKFPDSEDYLGRALEQYRKTDNMEGIARTSGNLGQLYLATGRLDTARRLLTETYDEAQRLEHDIMTQYASMNLGFLKKEEANLVKDDAAAYGAQMEQAAGFFRYALDYGGKTDSLVQRTCIRELYSHYTAIGNEAGCKALAAKFPDLVAGRASTGPKDVLFVLDVSGSMAGSRIKACRRNIENIIRNKLNHASDFVGMIAFSSDCRVIHFEQIARDRTGQVSFTPLSGNVDRIIDTINANTRPGGGTSFYQALLMGLQGVYHDKTGRSPWVIALTDGEDNRSEAKGVYPANVIEFLHAHSVNLILIAAGEAASQVAQMERMATAAKDSGDIGVLISTAADDAGLNQAFKQVEDLLVGDVVMETFT